VFTCDILRQLWSLRRRHTSLLHNLLNQVKRTSILSVSITYGMSFLSYDGEKNYIFVWKKTFFLIYIQLVVFDRRNLVEEYSIGFPVYFSVLILNMILILHESESLTIKISKYDRYLPNSMIERMVFLNINKVFFQTTTSCFLTWFNRLCEGGSFL
jgi:hypothetical protein